jgi:hypothetical protein
MILQLKLSHRNHSVYRRMITNDIFSVFGCDRCEDDLVNSCEADTCSEHGMCQNLVSQKLPSQDGGGKNL